MVSKSDVTVGVMQDIIRTNRERIECLLSQSLDPSERSRLRRSRLAVNELELVYEGMQESILGLVLAYGLLDRDYDSLVSPSASLDMETRGLESRIRECRSSFDHYRDLAWVLLGSSDIVTGS